MKSKVKDRIVGSMLGASIGDALGYMVRNKSYSQIVEEYGEGGNVSYNPDADGLVKISADTQLMLFTANGILFGATRMHLKGVLGAGLADYIREVYKDWYEAQTGTIDYCNWHCSWIRDIPQLSERRSPSRSAMKAFQYIYQKGNSDLPIESYGSGCMARVLPVPLMYGNRNDSIKTTDMMRISGDVAMITHRHPMAYLSCSLYSYIIYSLLVVDSPTSYDVYSVTMKGVGLLKEIYPGKEMYVDTLSKLVEKVVGNAFSGLTDEEGISRIGHGWTAPESLAIAVFCIMRYPDNFEKAIQASIRHSGNSSTTGAITGGLMGAMVGLEAVPDKQKVSLELGWLVETLANDITKAALVPCGYYESCYDTEEKREWMYRYVDSMALDKVPVSNSFVVDKGLKIYAGVYPEYGIDNKWVAPISSIEWSEFSYFYDLSAPDETGCYSTSLKSGQNYSRLSLFWNERLPATSEVTRWIRDIFNHVSPLLESYGGGDLCFNSGGRIYIHGGRDIRRIGVFLVCLYAWLLKDKEVSSEKLYAKALTSMNRGLSQTENFKCSPYIPTSEQEEYIWKFIKNECKAVTTQQSNEP